MQLETERLHLHRIYATCDFDNPASYRIMKNAVCEEKGISEKAGSVNKQGNGQTAIIYMRHLKRNILQSKKRKAVCFSLLLS